MEEWNNGRMGGGLSESIVRLIWMRNGYTSIGSRGGTCVNQAQMMSADLVEGVGRYRWGNYKGEGDCCGRLQVLW